uniref:NADH-ubiquinone oxidoreductase chain 4L n=1 Tax=Cherax destructor TaxID=6723 RepID=W6MV53_CHEDE|nr:NADH dehydrogenase subunit 4L [Cherax destructor]AIA61534.1 NADH dehydrogenase subunit 4L [Cherax destructor]WRV01071.1 NADH dehydrogenase subunit 4L [Cherax destructor albidus]CDL72707.1 NADH dehydrogenase subunit 4L [Cherax destructor]
MMMNSVEVISFMIVAICGLGAFISNHKHLLNVLLGLEFVMLSIFGMVSVNMSGVGLEVVFVMFFLVMTACEGALGLSLLVSVVRSHGNDYFSSFGILVC